MENKFKNQILSEELQNITIENQEEPSKHGEEEETEDTTRYGEFVTSYFCWLGMDEQRKRAEELQKMTENRNKKYTWKNWWSPLFWL